jgi:hypothetical protein
MLSQRVKDWTYFVNVAGERIACQLSIEKDHLIVYLNSIIYYQLYLLHSKFWYDFVVRLILEVKNLK